MGNVDVGEFASVEDPAVASAEALKVLISGLTDHQTGLRLHMQLLSTSHRAGRRIKQAIKVCCTLHAVQELPLENALRSPTCGVIRSYRKQ